MSDTTKTQNSRENDNIHERWDECKIRHKKV